MKFASPVNEKPMCRSNLELFRILTMLVIIAHHYVVNSGLLPLVGSSGGITRNDIFLLLFSWGGKTRINCFLLITGYFMCTSEIRWGKYLKLVGQVYFYCGILTVFFICIGYVPPTFEGFLSGTFPAMPVSDAFGPAFLLFYPFIPFLNILLKAMTEKQHTLLLGLCLLIYTVLPSFFNTYVQFNYITWFIILYLLAAHLRLHPRKQYENTAVWGAAMLSSIFLSSTSVLLIAYGNSRGRWNHSPYFFVADCNKILAVVTAVCAFLFFKNLKVPQSRWINACAASTFGVLLIHANSNTMRQWLWEDMLGNSRYYSSDRLVIHGICSVIGVFVVCTILDRVRILLLERPVEKYRKTNY